MALIELLSLSKHYPMGQEFVRAVDDLTLTICENEYIAIVGPSGCGKSTLMNLLGCLDTATSGQYLLNGRDISTVSADQLAGIRSRQIGFIFQNFQLLPRSSALENVMQPLIYHGVRLGMRRQAAMQMLERIGLEHRAHHLPNELSGGQRQRVAIARALVTRPALLLADEPTGNLDSSTSAEIMTLLDELHRAGHTLVVVTHDDNIAKHCRRIVRLQDGRLVMDCLKASPRNPVSGQ